MRDTLRAVPPAQVTVLADAGPTVGLGHLSRAGAVAAALRAQGHAVRAVVLGAEGVEHDGIAWAAAGAGGDGGGEPLAAAVAGEGPLLVDSYRVDVAALARGGGDSGRAVAVFWDGVGDEPEGAALAITLRGEDGPRLACLRPMFWGVAPRAVAPEVRRVLVATGGGAAGGTGALAETVRGALPDVEVAAILGPYADEALPDGVIAVRTPPRMADALQAADLVVTAAGQTMLETLCVGTPCVATAVVDNQRAQLDLLASRGGVWASDADAIGAAVVALAANRAERERLAAAGRKLVDGFGALRVAGRIARL